MNYLSLILPIILAFLAVILIRLIIVFTFGKLKPVDSRGRPLGPIGPKDKTPRWQILVGLLTALFVLVLPAFVVTFELSNLYFHPPLWMQMRLVASPIYFVSGIGAVAGLFALFLLASVLGFWLTSIIVNIYPARLRDSLGGSVNIKLNPATKITLYGGIPLALLLTSLAGLQSFTAFTSQGLVTNSFWQIHSSTLPYSEIASVHIGCKPAVDKYGKIFAVGITMYATNKSGKQVDISPTTNPDQLDNKLVPASTAADDIRNLKTRLQRENVTLTRQACDSNELPHFSQYQAVRYSTYFTLP